MLVQHTALKEDENEYEEYAEKVWCDYNDL